MITKAILTIATASSMTYGATDAFDAARDSALQMSNIYTIAGQVSEAAFRNDFSHDASLYQAASQLQPMAERVIHIGESQLPNAI